jgi:mRNA-degrading endonuclease RelE of RelBE toxin-antitoxin system
MNVILTESARKALKNLDSDTRKLLGAEIRKLQNDAPVNLKKMKTERHKLRIAVGEWRIMLDVRFEENGKLYYVTDVVMRKDAYRQ